jgi:outer membrane protein OmpA-like peptidoglycan-associated protein
MELSHPEYEPGTCAGTIPEERPEGDEELIVEVKCELVALPRKGSVDGKVVSEAGDAVSGADIKLMGPETKNLTTGSDGSFEVADLTPGTYNARVEADGYLIKLHEFDVEARETAQPEVTLLEKPRRSLVRVRRRQIQIRRQINFATDSAEIEPSSFPLMHQIADVLMRNPQIERVEIQGHTDNRGSAQHNMDLSQSRAESVRQWLIDHGVEASRLEAKGYGQTRPLVPNITPANRARNRRVQFIIKERAAEEE